MSTPITLLDAIAASDEHLGAPIAPPAAAPDTGAGSRRFVLLTIASTHYAVPEAYVTELERVPAITPVPHVPAWMRGVTNLRGDIISVIDMRTFLALDAPPVLGGRMLVVRLLDEPFATGLLVDAVDRIVTVPVAGITPPAAAVEGPLVGFLSGVCTIGERLVAVLDLDRLLRSPDIRQFDEPTEVEEGA
jgi:purine-binding chemotaxis protein CheW